MFRVKTTVLCVCGAFTIAGCASLMQQKGAQLWTVQPAFGVKHSGPNAEAMYELGRYYHGQDRYDDAIVAYRDALAQDRGYADAHNALGVIYAEQGRYDEAMHELQAALAISPRAAYLHNNLGYALLLRGSNEEAVKVLEEARRLEPGYPLALYNLGVAYGRVSEAQRARRAAQADASTAATASQANSVPGSAEVPTTPDSDVRLVAVAPNVYELQTAAAAATYAEKKPLTTAGIQVVTVDPTADAPHEQLKPFKLEVSNGNGVSSMARRVARFLEGHGIATGRLTNATTFQQPRTQIEYREGYRTEAVHVGSALPKPVPAVQGGALRSDIHVRVIVGRDLGNDTALFDPQAPKLQVAANVKRPAGR